MCGRFTYLFAWAELHEQLSGFLETLRNDVGPEISEQPRRYNIAPTQPILTIRREGGAYQPQLMRWGLVPEWVKNPQDFPLIINARAETMGEKASFRSALKNRRCIVPASGYYEWRKNSDGSKTPHYITLKDGNPMLFAGFHSTWMGPDGEEIDTAAIVTIASEGEMQDLHDRTPAILDEKQAAIWLDTANVSGATANGLIAKLKIAETLFHAVASRVGSVRNDDEGLITPVYEDKPEQPENPEPAPKKASGQLDLF